MYNEIIVSHKKILRSGVIRKVKEEAGIAFKTNTSRGFY
jgi:hypothetical protein